MTKQTFTHAGISPTAKGLKVRFTNNLTTRVKRLSNGSAEFMQLPSKMNKLDAANWLLQNPKVTENADAVAAVQKVIARFNKGTKAAKVSTPKAASTTTKVKSASKSAKAAAAPAKKGAVRVATRKKAPAAEVQVEAAPAAE